ncbi:MAG: ribonuclease III [Christensenellaceae bacterium]|nr:ribonuclease III [Christensenellaceae bacterium]
MTEKQTLNTNGLLSGISDVEARFKNPLVLAYIGDTVYDLYVRSTLVKSSSLGINEIHKKACSMVNARAQARIADKLMPLFNEEETDIFKRGRNSKSGIPKNMTPADYHAATGLEAVIGYLYLTGKADRIEEFFEVILNG